MLDWRDHYFTGVGGPLYSLIERGDEAKVVELSFRLFARFRAARSLFAFLTILFLLSRFPPFPASVRENLSFFPRSCPSFIQDITGITYIILEVALINDVSCFFSIRRSLGSDLGDSSRVRNNRGDELGSAIERISPGLP